MAQDNLIARGWPLFFFSPSSSCTYASRNDKPRGGEKEKFLEGHFVLCFIFLVVLFWVAIDVLISVTKFQIRTEPEKGTFFELRSSERMRSRVDEVRMAILSRSKSLGPLGSSILWLLL